MRCDDSSSEIVVASTYGNLDPLRIGHAVAVDDVPGRGRRRVGIAEHLEQQIGRERGADGDADADQPPAPALRLDQPRGERREHRPEHFRIADEGMHQERPACAGLRPRQIEPEQALDRLLQCKQHRECGDRQQRADRAAWPPSTSVTAPMLPTTAAAVKLAVAEKHMRPTPVPVERRPRWRLDDRASRPFRRRCVSPLYFPHPPPIPSPRTSHERRRRRR